MPSSRTLLFAIGDPAGIRTQDPRLKRALLYQLSYRIINLNFNFLFAFL